MREWEKVSGSVSFSLCSLALGHIVQFLVIRRIMQVGGDFHHGMVGIGILKIRFLIIYMDSWEAFFRMLPRFLF